ncbi:MAG TPA: hypothetical protein VIJ94_01385 [Caulobacteraceae bacterium]
MLADQRKSLFHLVKDSRIEIQLSFDPERPPHLIVIPCPKLSKSFDESVRDLPPEAFAGAAVALEATGKGTEPSVEFMHCVQDFLAERGIPEERCAFVANNRRAILPGSSIRILHYDYWLRRMFKDFHKRGLAEFEFREANFRARGRHRPRRFLSFNMTARPWKLLFLLSLLRDGLWDAGYISFGGFAHVDRPMGETLDQVAAELLQTRGFEDLASDVLRFLPSLDAKGKVLFGQIPHTRQGVIRKATDGVRVEEFDLTWFSATTETEMSATKDYVTEKPFKAMLNFHPQVILGNPGALVRLRSFGFQSFSPWIDESYDQETNPRRRFELVYAEVRRLCAADEAEMARLEHELSEILVANARWGLVDMPRKYREVWDPEIVANLLALSPAASELPI